MNGEGARTGPDLSNISALRTPDYLQRTLLNPQASVIPMNSAVHAVTKSGQSITGRRLHEDAYTIQLVNSQGKLISLTKADLREFKVSRTTDMPSYKDKFSAKETADIVAYLLSLKGIQ